MILFARPVSPPGFRADLLAYAPGRPNPRTRLAPVLQTPRPIQGPGGVAGRS